MDSRYVIHQKIGLAPTLIEAAFNPASGYRNNNDGGLNNVGNNGNYWSVTPNSNNAYNLNFNNNGNVNPSNNNNRANGQSVRCLQEIDEVAGANAEESK